MLQFEKIKLIIWDLDDTFWQGTLSEGGVIIPEKHKKLLHKLIDLGIMNSICSKNDWGPVENELVRQGLAELFVFPSVNWEAKGKRIKDIIQNMQLRPVNVLFIDDNHSNREEARFFCKDIFVEGPDCLPELFNWAMVRENTDTEHKRLKQYKVLEKKHEMKSEYTSNEEFLYESNIQVTVEHDCVNQLERIHDLILRSNQLNFTKVRSSKEELQVLLSNLEIESGYISAKDRFGEYGIIGFYALKDNSLIHFVFSCRTLGMGIEQYIYNYLKRPALTIVGEVISNLDIEVGPKWINQDIESDNGVQNQMQLPNISEHIVLIKGPCDLFQIYPYIEKNNLFDTEFTYTTDNGLAIESTGHTTHMVESVRLSAEQKEKVLSEVPFTDAGMYCNDWCMKPYKVVVVSPLSDPNLGVYRNKKTGSEFAFLEYIRPLTDPNLWDDYISGKLDGRGFKFTREILEKFAEEYEFVGRNTPEKTVKNLQYIREKLSSECTLVIMLGGELEYEKNTFEAYVGRHLIHKEMNKLIREFASQYNNVRLIDVNRYLVDQNSFYDHFNHYIKPVYYSLAKDLVDIINDCTDSQIQESSKLMMVKIVLKERFAPLYYKLRKVFRR